MPKPKFRSDHLFRAFRLRAAHREFTWRHLKVSVGLDTKTRDRYAAAFSGTKETP